MAGDTEAGSGLAGLADGTLDLIPTALALSDLGRREPGFAPYLAHIAALAEEAARGAGPEAAADCQGAALAAVMQRHYGGYPDETAEVGLAAAITARTGPADTLGVLALATARQAGWRADALAFPARFLLRLEGGDGRRIILDPAAGWREAGPPELRALLKAALGGQAELTPDHYAPLGNREILVRLQNAAKHRLLRQGRIAEALAVVEATLLFAPGQTALWREAGMMHLRLDRLPAAVAALEQFASRTGNPLARRRTVDLLHQLRGRLS